GSVGSPAVPGAPTPAATTTTTPEEDKEEEEEEEPVVTPRRSSRKSTTPASPQESPTSPPPEEDEEEEEEEEPVVTPRRSSRKRKRPASVAAEGEKEKGAKKGAKGGDPPSSSSPSSSSSSSASSDSDSDSDDDPRAALVRVCCLRCAKHLAKSPEFSCVFPKTSTKCTRCTRLKDKCVPIPSSVARAVRNLLHLQRSYDRAPAAVKQDRRDLVVACAAALPAKVRVAASVALPAADVNAAILANQVEMLAVLRQMQRDAAAERKERRKEKKGKGAERGQG
ncbi:hypothetical protein V501_00854, partial [Pseudogymnoascus sp. VKM F-4519 (FW-2642)]